MKMTVTMGRINRKNEEVVTDVFFHSSTQILLTVKNFDEQYEIMIAEILRRIDEFIKMGSGAGTLKTYCVWIRT